jgi:tetratricopeptide (TPR) repeat protein
VTGGRTIVAAALCIAVVVSGCVRFGSRTGPTVEPLRISEVAAVGDPARRASQRIVLKGLDADVVRQTDRALGTYEEALRVDPTNPYAYLALARHHADSADPEWALSYLDKADALFRAEGGASPRVEPHLVGLRGQALYGSGQVDAGLPYLERAWDLAPEVWTDGRLTADELR